MFFLTYTKLDKMIVKHVYGNPKNENVHNNLEEVQYKEISFHIKILNISYKAINNNALFWERYIHQWN